jgi:hypothetical protein
MYNDEWPTCDRTYATFRLYHADLDPEDVSTQLGLVPSATQRRGAPVPSSRGRLAPIGGWFLSTKGVIDSRDVRRHVDWLLERLAPRAATLVRYRESGYRADIFCSWYSAQGHGGPALSPPQLALLAKLELEIGFDIYGV